MITVPRIVCAEINECPSCSTDLSKRERGEDQGQCRNPKCKRRWLPAASWLFEGRHPTTGERFPKPKLHESFSTALFALFLLSPGDKRFPVRKVVDPHYTCQLENEDLDLSKLSYEHLTKVNPSKGADLIVRGPKNRLVHIENKPFATDARSKIETYACEAAKVEAQFLVLISCGNSQPGLWDTIREKEIPVLLWEEVLLEMDRANFATYLSPVAGGFEPYYDIYRQK